MRKLTLNKEVLAELSTTELSAVLGGAGTQVCVSDPCITPQPSRHLGCTFSLGPDLCG